MSLVATAADSSGTEHFRDNRKFFAQAKKEGLIQAAVGLNVTYRGIPQASKSNWNFKWGPRRPGVTLPLMSQVFGN